MNTAPTLKMFRGISFGPAAQNEAYPEKKVGQTKIEDQNQLKAPEPPLMKKPTKGPSIASFLKSNLKTNTINNLVGMSASASALFNGKSENSMSKSPSFNPFQKDIKEEEKNLDSIDYDEMDDMEDMDIDDIPEPSLK